MNDSTLMSQALSSELDIHQNMQRNLNGGRKSQSVCRFSSTIAAQQRL